MSDDDLIAAGFKRYPPSSIDRYDELFQLRVRDSNGTRYFINVKRWDHADDHTSYEAEVCYDGCAFHPAAATRVTTWSVIEWTPQDVIAWADELWTRLAPNYYERDQ